MKAKSRLVSRGIIFLVGLALPLAFSPGLANASLVTYAGYDPGVLAGGARPNSDAAHAAFLSAINPPTGTITFEGLALGYSASPIGVAPGVTLTLVNGDSTWAGIRTGNTSNLGYNTTLGGNRFLGMSPPPSGGNQTTTATFAFASPISSFGAYLTGTETGYIGNISVKFNDGSSHTLNITKNSNPGVQFFGFTDDSLLISSVAFVESGNFSNRDIWGIDDVSYGSPVPEPATWMAGALLLLPFGVKAMRHLRNRIQTA